MEKTLKLFMIILILTVISCKSTHTTTTRDHIVSDTIINHHSEVIQLPVHYTYIDATPCKNDSLMISSQLLEIGKLRIRIRNLNGKLAIETNTDSIVNSKVDEILKHAEKENIYITKTITKKYIPKYIYYILGIFLLYIVYRILRIYIPAIRWLPY